MEQSRKTVLAVFLLFCGALLGAQSAAFLDGILASPALNAADAAYLAAASAEAVAESADPAAAFALAQEKGWLGKGVAPEALVSVASYAQMLAKAFSIKGSLMYAIIPLPRYAFKNLSALGIIQGDVEPTDKLSGELALRMAAAAAEYADERAAAVAAETEGAVEGAEAGEEE